MINGPVLKIHTIQNFISPEECEAMEESARPRLHDATVADDRGGSKLSESCKAKQAVIKEHWNGNAEGDDSSRG